LGLIYMDNGWQRTKLSNIARTTNDGETYMLATENKKIMQRIFAELAKGNSQPFVDSMADDFSWTVTGTTKWSRKYAGKRAVLEELFGALLARLIPPIVVEASRFIADDDCVVVEARGKNTTKSGAPYHNAYCFVFRLADGTLKDLTEYLDTELVTAALGD
jgi:ketosteroid isomerase-like protein